MEVCYINETILEEEEEEESDFGLELNRGDDVEEEEDEEEYEYEEDYRSSIVPIPRSKTDWEIFRLPGDHLEQGVAVDNCSAGRVRGGSVEDEEGRSPCYSASPEANSPYQHQSGPDFKSKWV